MKDIVTRSFNYLHITNRPFSGKGERTAFRLTVTCGLTATVLSMLLLLLHSSARGAPNDVCRWTGPSDLVPRNWSSVANWDCGHVPGPDDTAVIENYGRIVNVDSPVFVQGLLLVNQSALYGYHTLTVTGQMEWSGEIVGGSWLSPTGALETVVIGSGAYLTISNSSRLIQGRLVNYGTSTQLPNQTNTLFRSVFDNRPGGTMRVQSGRVEGYWNVDDPGLIHNRGRLVKEGDTEFTVKVGLTNDGLIDVPTGTLKIQLPANRQVVTHTGTISVTAPGVLALNAYEHHFEPSSAIVGDGTFRLENGARATVLGNYTLTGLTDVGNVNTLLDLHTPSGAVELAYLQMGNSTDLAGSSDITVTRAMTIAAYRALIHGSTGVSDTFNMGPDAHLLVDSSGGISHRTLNNYGAIEQKSPHCFSVLSEAIFNNQASGVYTVTKGTMASCIPFVSPSGSFHNYGRLDKIGPDGFEISYEVPVTNQGVIAIHDGVLRADNFEQSAGETLLLNGSTLSSQNDDIILNGGTLAGNGTIDLFQDRFLRNNRATVDPAGLLVLDEEYSQGISGTLHIDISGLTPGSSYDQFQVAGQAQLDGRLVLSPTAGFIPTSGDVFQVMTYGARSGEFSEIVHGLGLAFGPEYQSDGIVISDNPTLVEFSQRADRSTIPPGEAGGFSLRLTNTHLETVSATFQNDLPPSFLYVNGSATSNNSLLSPTLLTEGNRQRLLWPTLPISPSAVITIHFGVKAPQTVGAYTNTATVLVTPTVHAPRTIQLHEQVDVSLVPSKNTVINVTNALAFPPQEANGPWKIAIRKGAPTELVHVEIISTPVCVLPACGPLKRFYALHDGQTFEMTLIDGTTDRYRTEILAGQFNIYERIYLVPVFETARHFRTKVTTGQTSGRCERAGTNWTVHVIFDSTDGLTPCNPITGEASFFDPSGFVTDAQSSQPIVGATVTLYRLPGARPDGRATTNDCRTVNTRPNNNWSGLPLATEGLGWMEDPLFSPAALDPAINPLKTDSTGYYGWDVVRGCWYIKVEASGYETAYSPVVGVPPEVTGLDIQMEPLPVQTEENIFLPAINR